MGLNQETNSASLNAATHTGDEERSKMRQGHASTTGKGSMTWLRSSHAALTTNSTDRTTMLLVRSGTKIWPIVIKAFFRQF
ncbi:hypothetical protein C7B82_08780 [Stenomitos frigidus ULC18]|uniref:Uncharacterized protein n=1 Tax=Stenomitos frigidus ULC18 TaxID=2107698 RepID=A0A2T1ECQ0_9CYAN|nr:hypothetical protein C7B82_08780 [Stenomitos frigidus ULC18]